MIDHPFVKLTNRQQEILRMMADEDEELTCDGRECWVGLVKTSWPTAKALLRYCLISGWQTDRTGSQYLYINGSGQAYLNGVKNIYRIAGKNGRLKASSSIPLAMFF